MSGARVLHQFVPNFAAGDAIGVHVRLTQDALRAAGWESEIFYDDAQAAVKKLGRHFSTWDRAADGRNGDAWILFQLSTGSRMTPFLLEQDVPFGVYFHNITPPLFFERWEPFPVAQRDLVRVRLVSVDGDDGMPAHGASALLRDLRHADRELGLHLREERCGVRVDERERRHLHERRTVFHGRTAVRYRDRPVCGGAEVDALARHGLPLTVRPAAPAAACKDGDSQEKRRFASDPPREQRRGNEAKGSGDHGQDDRQGLRRS